MKLINSDLLLKELKDRRNDMRKNHEGLDIEYIDGYLDGIGDAIDLLYEALVEEQP